MNDGALAGLPLLLAAVIVALAGAAASIRHYVRHHDSLGLLTAIANMAVAVVSFLALAVVACRLSGLGP